jgi:hypothetical protein
MMDQTDYNPLGNRPVKLDPFGDARDQPQIEADVHESTYWVAIGATPAKAATGPTRRKAKMTKKEALCVVYQPGAGTSAQSS